MLNISVNYRQYDLFLEASEGMPLIQFGRRRPQILFVLVGAQVAYLAFLIIIAAFALAAGDLAGGAFLLVNAFVILIFAIAIGVRIGGFWLASLIFAAVQPIILASYVAFLPSKAVLIGVLASLPAGLLFVFLLTSYVLEIFFEQEPPFYPVRWRRFF